VVLEPRTPAGVPVREGVILNLQRTVTEVARAVPAASWSICIRTPDGRPVAEHDAGAVLATASVGKVLLLAETARRLETDPGTHTARLRRGAVPPVGEAGLWQHLDADGLSVSDTAFLIGSFSDNLATNVLLDYIGLDAVTKLTHSSGLMQTALLDRVRAERGPGDPPCLSVGSAAELSDLMNRLAHGTLVSQAVSARVRLWLSTDADLSMVLASFDLDPLAHTEAGVFHKTGSDPGTRVDTGIVRREGRGLAYAVIVNWPDSMPELLGAAIAGMRHIGEGLRDALDREPPPAAAQQEDADWRGPTT
jgi:beta-lactamase class A